MYEAVIQPGTGMVWRLPTEPPWDTDDGEIREWMRDEYRAMAQVAIALAHDSAQMKAVIRDAAAQERSRCARIARDEATWWRVGSAVHGMAMNVAHTIEITGCDPELSLSRRS